MKLPKEQVFVIIVGLFLLSYLLEAIVDPLKLSLATPYSFLSPNNLYKYPFATATIFIRALSLFLAPLLLLSFFSKSYYPKFGFLLILSALAQLYALQEVASGTTLIPLEWSLSLTIAGAGLLVPAIFQLIFGLIHSTKKKFSTTDTVPSEEDWENKISKLE